MYELTYSLMTPEGTQRWMVNTLGKLYCNKFYCFQLKVTTPLMVIFISYLINSLVLFFLIVATILIFDCCHWYSLLLSHYHLFYYMHFIFNICSFDFSFITSPISFNSFSSPVSCFPFSLFISLVSSLSVSVV